MMEDTIRSLAIGTHSRFEEMAKRLFHANNYEERLALFQEAKDVHRHYRELRRLWYESQLPDISADEEVCSEEDGA